MGELITGQAATYVEEMHVNTNERYEIICITKDVQRIISESGIKDGLVLVNPMHITASCYVNDLEYGLHHDIMKWLNKIAPFYHNHESSSSHSSRLLVVLSPDPVPGRFSSAENENAFAGTNRLRCAAASD